jgi:perosamine synthetase
VNFFHSHIDREAIKQTIEVLESGFVSEGKVVADFENRLVSELNIDRPITVNSGTSALHLGLAVIGVGPGDEVVVPAQTFIATAQAVLMCGAKPVFADISPLDGNMTAQAFKDVITPRTKAVIPVHWAGYPCDMDAINGVADEAGVAVIEDAAHALGSSYKGRPTGSLSRFTAFSFQAIKHLTTGDGGALCCRDAEDAHQASALRWFGVDRSATTPNELGERNYDLAQLGFKYHMNNVAAGIGLGNLKTLKARLARHQYIAQRYLDGIHEDESLRLPDYKDNRQSSWWFFPLLVEQRGDFVRAMQAREVACSVVHRRIDKNSLYAEFMREMPGQNEFDKLQINLPVHVGLSDEDIEKVIEAVHAGW